MALSKAEREDGWVSVPQPTPLEVAVLRRVARGYLLRTNGEDRKGNLATWFTYDDGTPMSHLTKKGFWQDELRAVERMVDNGWLIPVEGESILDGPPQRYRARTVKDGPLPKFVR